MKEEKEEWERKEKKNREEKYYDLGGVDEMGLKNKVFWVLNV